VKEKLGDYQGAVDDYSVAIKLDTSYYMAYNNRGSAKFQLGDYEGALADFNKGISFRNDYLPVMNNMGGVLAKLNNLDEAAKLFDQILIDDQSFGYAYLNRGFVRELLGDINGACQDWKAANDLGVTEAEKYLKECK
jgi:tetratricopeptide (TPR) repeat protein